MHKLIRFRPQPTCADGDVTFMPVAYFVVDLQQPPVTSCVAVRLHFVKVGTFGNTTMFSRLFCWTSEDSLHVLTGLARCLLSVLSLSYLLVLSHLPVPRKNASTFFRLLLTGKFSLILITTSCSPLRLASLLIFVLIF